MINDTMNITLAQLNPLPLRTWRYTGVNNAAVQLAFAPPAPYSGQTHSTGGHLADISVTGPHPHPKTASAMGTQMGPLIETHRSAGFYVRMPAGLSDDEPVVFSYMLDASNPAILDENLIVAEENSVLTVLLSYSGHADTEGMHAGLTRVIAHAGARVRLVQVQLLSDTCTHLHDIAVELGKDAAVEIVQAELGARAVYTGCHAHLVGEGSSFTLHGISLGDGERTGDFNYIAHHTGKSSHSEIHSDAALLGSAQRLLRSTIDFVSGCEGAAGREIDDALLLSPSVRNRTVPLILCGEADVEGEHASTSGKVDDALLFYLMSRGLSAAQAKRLIVEARFEEAAKRIPDESLRTQIYDFVAERLDADALLSR